MVAMVEVMLAILEVEEVATVTMAHRWAGLLEDLEEAENMEEEEGLDLRWEWVDLQDLVETMAKEAVVTVHQWAWVARQEDSEEILEAEEVVMAVRWVWAVHQVDSELSMAEEAHQWDESMDGVVDMVHKWEEVMEDTKEEDKATAHQWEECEVHHPMALAAIMVEEEAVTVLQEVSEEITVEEVLQ